MLHARVCGWRKGWLKEGPGAALTHNGEMMRDGVEENRVNMSPGCSTTRSVVPFITGSEGEVRPQGSEQILPPSPQAQPTDTPSSTGQPSSPERVMGDVMKTEPWSVEQQQDGGRI